MSLGKIIHRRNIDVLDERVANGSVAGQARIADERDVSAGDIGGFPWRAGSNIAAKIAIMAMTINSSIRVKPGSKNPFGFLKICGVIKFGG